MAYSISKLIHNRFVLYSVFLIALVDFIYLVSINDNESASLFGLIGILTAFFSKNMIIILSVAVIITNIVKYGKVKGVQREGVQREGVQREGVQREGLKTKEKKDTDDEDEDEDDNKLSVDNSKVKEKFGQDKQIVKTAEEDNEIDKSDKMILAQEKILERMNKYKPLLDTLNGLTKNIAIVKGLSSETKE
jgi:uncharacterized membrane protein